VLVAAGFGSDLTPTPPFSTQGRRIGSEMKLQSQNVLRLISFLVGPVMGGLLIAWAAWVGVGPASQRYAYWALLC
jgi:hypothetical protein